MLNAAKLLSGASLILLMACDVLPKGQGARLSLASPDASVIPTCSYSYEERLMGNYVYEDPNPDKDAGVSDWLQPHAAFVDLEHKANYTEQGNIRASDVAELAWLMTRIHSSKDMPNNDLVYDILSSGHFIVTEDPATFDSLKDDAGITEEWDLASSYILGHNPPCWEIPNNGQWTSVIKQEYLRSDDVSVIVHVMTHVAAFASYGDPDTNHENHDLWSRWGGGSLMGRAIQAYEIRYSPGQCWSDR